MRADSLAGQVVAVLSRRTPAFRPNPDEPQTFPGRLRALFGGSRATSRRPDKIVKPVGPDEVGIVSGRWGLGRGPVRVVLTGRARVVKGERLDLLSTALRPVGFSVACQSADDVPMTIMLRGAFSIPRVESAIRAVIENFRLDEDVMREWVTDCFQAQVRYVAGRHTAAQAEQESGLLAAEATRRAVPYLTAMGLQLTPLIITDVELPAAAYLREKARARELQARLAAVDVHNEIEDRSSAAAARREAAARLEHERAKADALRYAEEQRIEAARLQMLLDEDKRAWDRRHERVMAELEAFRLFKSLEVRSQYQETIIREKLVNDLPKILEAKGKLLPTLRTYFAGARGTEGQNELLELMAGLAELGPEIMQEVHNLLGSIRGEVPPQLTAEHPPSPIEPSSAPAADTVAGAGAEQVDVHPNPTRPPDDRFRSAADGEPGQPDHEAGNALPGGQPPEVDDR
jgi:regulator of protease activity HflC (stomatin/prohibitin superfamily)